MKSKKRKKKVPPKITLEARLEPVNGKIVPRISTPESAKPLTTAASCKKSTQDHNTAKRANAINNQDSPKPGPPTTASTVGATESALNFFGIKEKAAQEAIFINRIESKPPVHVEQPQQLAPTSQPQKATVENSCVPLGGEPAADGVRAVPEESASSPPPVELKVVADLVADKDVFGHISLLK